MDPNLTKNISIGLPPQLKNSRNALIELVLLAVVGILFGWFIVLPKNADWAAQKDALAKTQVEHDQMADKLKSLQAMIRTMQANPQKIGDLDQALPLDGNVVRLKLLMDALAYSSGVTVGDVSVTSAKADDVVSGNKELLAKPYAVARSLQKLSVSVYVIGAFPQLKAFLQKLETSARILDVNELSLDGAANGTLNMRLSLNSYYLAP